MVPLPSTLILLSGIGRSSVDSNPETIYLLLKNRRIPAFRLGSGWRFRRSDIDQWISDMQMKPEDAGGPGRALTHLHGPWAKSQE